MAISCSANRVTNNSIKLPVLLNTFQRMSMTTESLFIRIFLPIILSAYLEIDLELHPVLSYNLFKVKHSSVYCCLNI